MLSSFCASLLYAVSGVLSSVVIFLALLNYLILSLKRVCCCNHLRFTFTNFFAADFIFHARVIIGACFFSEELTKMAKNIRAIAGATAVLVCALFRLLCLRVAEH